MMLRTLLTLTAAVVLASPAAAQRASAPATPQARAALADFARCAVSRSALKAHAVLTADFRTETYRRGLRSLSESNRDCHQVRATMRAGGLPFAAALAEALIHRNPVPLKSRLARAAVGNQARTYGPSDAVAMCVARSVPDDVTALLTAPIASPAENAAAARLATPLRICNRGRPWVQTDAYGLRSMVATATYRLLAAQGQAASR